MHAHLELLSGVWCMHINFMDGYSVCVCVCYFRWSMHSRSVNICTRTMFSYFSCPHGWCIRLATDFSFIHKWDTSYYLYSTPARVLGTQGRTKLTQNKQKILQATVEKVPILQNKNSKHTSIVANKQTKWRCMKEYIKKYTERQKTCSATTTSCEH